MGFTTIIKLLISLFFLFTYNFLIKLILLFVISTKFFFRLLLILIAFIKELFALENANKFGLLLTNYHQELIQ